MRIRKTKKNAVSEIVESLRQTARDLTTLEINTIVKDNMTARKMPPPGHALLDIAAFYADKIQYGLDIPLATPFAPNNPRAVDMPHVEKWAQQKIERADLKCNDQTFRRLRRAAYRILEDCIDLKSHNRIVIQRIMRNSDQLRTLLRRLETRHAPSADDIDTFLGCSRTKLIDRETELGRHPGPDLRPDEITHIRKIWDVGVEHIVMQSTVTLTGDVINRVQSKTGPEDVAALLGFHREGIVAGGRMWKLIAETLVSMTGVFVRLLGK